MEKQHADLVKHNQEHFDEQSAKWDDDPEYVAVSKESYATLIEHLGKCISRDKTEVLNFGCGTGLLEDQLRRDVKQIVGVDVSGGSIERMRRKIEQGKWANVKAMQLDILDESNGAAQELQKDGFDLIVSCYTFHHLKDVTAIGQTLMRYLKPGGYFCTVDFAKGTEQQQKEFHSNLPEEAKASIGEHDGFSKDFLFDYYQSQLGLENVKVHTARPLKCEGDEFPTIVAYGQKPEEGQPAAKVAKRDAKPASAQLSGFAPAARPSVPPGGGVAAATDDPLRVMDSQRRHGDFEGDLLPGGPQPGGLHGLPPHGGGSQVGPDHPIFDRMFGDDDGNNYSQPEPPSFGVPGVDGMEIRPR